MGGRAGVPPPAKLNLATACENVRVSPWKRVWIALAALVAVIAGGTVGYWILGLSPLHALYQTVITVSTVGFGQLFHLTRASEVFTIVLILLGVGTALYAFGVLIEALIEGQLADLVGRRKMDRQISSLSDHVILCGWGRSGRVIAANLAAAGQPVVVIDQDPERLVDVEYPNFAGDATEDAVLEKAGIARARGLAAVTSSDATNLYITLSSRSLRPDLFIIARARVVESEAKLLRAGANRVVNPQSIGGTRAAAFLLKPHVADFIDVVSHGLDVEFTLGQIELSDRSALAGLTLREARIRERTGALVLATRLADGSFLTNPSADSITSAGQVLIAIGTADQLADLDGLARGGSPLTEPRPPAK